MDIATLLGLFLGWGALITCLYMEGGGFAEMTNLPAFLLVVIGTIGATIIGNDVKTALTIPKVLKNVIKVNIPDTEHIIDSVVGLAKVARQKGILALDDLLDGIDNAYLKKGIQQVVDGTPSMVIREVLETEIAALQDRHKTGEAFFVSMGGFSPTMGIIGTVLGLINMLARLDEPSKMGHAIAAAFVATLYGVAFANLFYLPIATKLKTRTADEVMICEMILEGVLSIQSGESPRSVENRMISFLPPELKLKRMEKNGYSEHEVRVA